MSEEIVDLKSMVSNYSSLWNESESTSVKSALLVDNEDDLEKQGRRMIDDLNEKDSVRVSIDSLHDQTQAVQTASFKQFVQNEVPKIGNHTRALIDSIQQIMIVESSNDYDVFTKSEEYEINMGMITNELRHLDVLLSDFRKSSNVDVEEVVLCSYIVNSVYKFSKDAADDTAYFLERGIPLLMRFLGFMALKFSDVVLKASLLANSSKLTEQTSDKVVQQQKTSSDTETKTTSSP